MRLLILALQIVPWFLVVTGGTVFRLTYIWKQIKLLLDLELCRGPFNATILVAKRL
jgi:hypothetical protein